MFEQPWPWWVALANLTDWVNWTAWGTFAAAIAAVAAVAAAAAQTLAVVYAYHAYHQTADHKREREIVIVQAVLTFLKDIDSMFEHLLEHSSTDDLFQRDPGYCRLPQTRNHFRDLVTPLDTFRAAEMPSPNCVKGWFGARTELGRVATDLVSWTEQGRPALHENLARTYDEAKRYREMLERELIRLRPKVSAADRVS